MLFSSVLLLISQYSVGAGHPNAQVKQIDVSLNKHLKNLKGLRWPKSKSGRPADSQFYDKPSWVTVTFPNGRSIRVKSDLVTITQDKGLIIIICVDQFSKSYTFKNAFRKVRNLCKSLKVDKQKWTASRFRTWAKGEPVAATSIRAILGYRNGVFIKLQPLYAVGFKSGLDKKKTRWTIRICFEQYNNWRGWRDLDPKVWDELEKTHGKKAALSERLPHPRAYQTTSVDKKIAVLFGKNAPELQCAIKLATSEFVLAANGYKISKDKRSILFKPCTIGWFRTKKGAGRLECTKILKSRQATLKLNRPVTSLFDLSKSRITAIYIRDTGQISFPLATNR